MNSKRRNEIKTKAKEINDLSENFQLIHATYATQEYIKDMTKEFYKQKLELLKVRICEKMNKDLDTSKEIEEKKRIRESYKKESFSYRYRLYSYKK